MLIQPLFLRPLDLMKIEGYTFHQAASRAYQVLLSALGKQKGQRITVEEYCNLYKISKDELIKHLATTRIPRRAIYNNDQPRLFNE